MPGFGAGARARDAISRVPPGGPAQHLLRGERRMLEGGGFESAREEANLNVHELMAEAMREDDATVAFADAFTLAARKR